MICACEEILDADCIYWWNQLNQHLLLFRVTLRPFHATIIETGLWSSLPVLRWSTWKHFNSRGYAQPPWCRGLKMSDCALVLSALLLCEMICACEEIPDADCMHWWNQLNRHLLVFRVTLRPFHAAIIETGLWRESASFKTKHLKALQLLVEHSVEPPLFRAWLSTYTGQM